MTAFRLDTLHDAGEAYRAVIAGNNPGQDLYCDLLCACDALASAQTEAAQHAARTQVHTIVACIQVHAARMGVMLPPATRMALDDAVQRVSRASARIIEH